MQAHPTQRAVPAQVTFFILGGAVDARLGGGAALRVGDVGRIVALDGTPNEMLAQLDGATAALARVWDALQGLVAFLVRSYREQARAGRGLRSLADAQRMLPREQGEELEERAAIREHEGGAERDAAERGAVAEFVRSQRGRRA